MWLIWYKKVTDLLQNASLLNRYTAENDHKTFWSIPDTLRILLKPQTYARTRRCACMFHSYRDLWSAICYGIAKMINKELDGKTRLNAYVLAGSGNGKKRLSLTVQLVWQITLDKQVKNITAVEFNACVFSHFSSSSLFVFFGNFSLLFGILHLREKNILRLMSYKRIGDTFN